MYDIWFMRSCVIGAERVLHPGNDVSGVQIRGGDGEGDGVRQQTPRRRQDRHERALLTLARRVPRHAGDGSPRHQQDSVNIWEALAAVIVHIERPWVIFSWHLIVSNILTIRYKCARIKRILWSQPMSCMTVIPVCSRPYSGNPTHRPQWRRSI